MEKKITDNQFEAAMEAHLTKESKKAPGTLLTLCLVNLLRLRIKLFKEADRDEITEEQFEEAVREHESFMLDTSMPLIHRTYSLMCIMELMHKLFGEEEELDAEEILRKAVEE